MMKSGDAEIKGQIVIRDAKIATPGTLHLRDEAQILGCIIDAVAVIQYGTGRHDACVVRGSIGLCLAGKEGTGKEEEA